MASGPSTDHRNMRFSTTVILTTHTVTTVILTSSFSPDFSNVIIINIVYGRKIATPLYLDELCNTFGIQSENLSSENHQKMHSPIGCVSSLEGNGSCTLRSVDDTGWIKNYFHFECLRSKKQRFYTEKEILGNYCYDIITINNSQENHLFQLHSTATLVLITFCRRSN